MTGTRLLVLARPPIAGRVKSRLAVSVGSAVALDAYRACLGRALIEAARAVNGSGAVEVLAAEGPDPPLRALLPAGATMGRQAPGDLGARLRAAFNDAFATGAERAVAIGADCPGVEADDLVAAASALGRAEVVVGPAEDGGYWLVGIRRPAWPRAAVLFDRVPWSTDAVLATTRARADEAGLAVAQIATRYDIDTAADLERAKREGLL